LTQPSGPAYRYIDNTKALDELADRMSRAGRVALDTEADSLHHYYEKTCLIQLTLDGENFVVDPLAGADLTRFLKVLSESRLILHSAEFDMRLLRNSYGFRPQNEVFDTMLAAQLLGYRKISLADMVEAFFDVVMVKKGQKSDWSRRPLLEGQLAYAVNDTRFLEPMAERQSEELHRLGRQDWHRESCERMIEATATDNPRDPDDVWRVKGHSVLKPRQLAFLQQLWHWREKEAQKVDHPPFMIIGNQQLLYLATWAAEQSSKDPIRDLPKLPRHFIGDRLRGLKQTMRRVQRMDSANWPLHRAGRIPVPAGPRFEQLKAECTRIAEELDIDSTLIANRRTLEIVSREQPREIEEMILVGNMMRWQAGLLAPGFFEIFDRPA
jgi:ribonuclease D